MPTELTRLRVSRFHSLRDVDLSLQGLSVLEDAKGTATKDLASLLALLKALAEGGLQRHLSETQVLGPAHGREAVRVELTFQDNQYGIELRPRPDGAWWVASESVDLLVGLSCQLLDPDRDSPRAEAALSLYSLEVPEPVAPRAPSDSEGDFLGHVLHGAMAWMRRVLMGIRIEPELSCAPAMLFFFEEADRDLPPNAIWERAQGIRATSSLHQVLLCTASAALAEAFDVRDVLRVDTRDGASSVR
ncbi:hypothetical protein MYSTI_03690 [Myxococcus stipitatus DSM 14675]|uniref:Uncharacterized protein n=1 Tax=Myxococcus stipitatus (strain DSM 14675 / JCM 12634 / Mx s8) TaxID=1278073 RepID=L7U7Y8_MYXSD|nr:hypothetical protein [Myxococcus stipitatus]AGC44996.1 hypothetical protein MYSTI_03690 [Myxococcus stipitatus DSM 14675]